MLHAVGRGSFGVINFRFLCGIRGGISQCGFAIQLVERRIKINNVGCALILMVWKTEQ